MNSFTEFFSIFEAIWDATTTWWWIVLPTVFYFLFKAFWMDYVIGDWLSDLSSKSILLEIIPPKDIERGPKPIEALFSGIAGVSVSIGVFDKYLRGTLMHRFSLELVGKEGEIHFYVRTDSKYRNLIEANIYAQYPDAEIFEVDDYTKEFPKTIPNKHWDVWGADMEALKPDSYPIRTYDDFKEDITGEMIDPMASVVEVFGHLKPGQHIWLQYVIWPQQEKWNKEKAQRDVVADLAGRLKKDNIGVWDDFVDVISNVFKGIFELVEFESKEKKEEQPLEFRLTPVEKDILKKVEENLSYNSFCVKMRYLVLGKKEVFDKSLVSTFTGALKQFSDQNLNSFKPQDVSKTFTAYLWKKPRLEYKKRKIYRRYKDRDMDGTKFTMSSREMATVFHFPDMGVMAPTMPRVDSKKGSAPANLPIFQ